MTHPPVKFRVTVRGMGDYVWRVRGFLDGLHEHCTSHRTHAQEFLSRVVQIQYAVGPDLNPTQLSELQECERKLSEAVDLLDAVLSALSDDGKESGSSDLEEPAQ